MLKNKDDSTEADFSENDIDQFQLVVSKSRCKEKRKKVKSTEVYLTRSKTSPYKTSS